MTVSYRDARKFPGTREQIILASEEAARRSGFKVREANGPYGWLYAKARISFWSWGENVTIRVDGDNIVHVTSESRVPFTLADYGKNSRNVNRFLGHLAALLSPAWPTGG